MEVPLCMVILASAALYGQVSVLTWHNDNARTGQNLQETALTPTNVNASSFGKLFGIAVDGKVDAQPLYVPAVAVPANGTHNVLYVVTEHDSAYAFDADNGTQLWHVSLLGAGEAPSDDRGCGQVTPEIGITSTPAIDPLTGPHGTMYVVAMSKNGSGTYHHRLHALDLATGAGQFGGPVEIQATYPGHGVENTFLPAQHKERPGLLIVNGVVYTSWSSHCDFSPYAGWVMGYSKNTLQQVSALNLTPNGNDAGIWAAGAGPAADASGNLYLLTGNGTFDTSLNSSGLPVNGDYGNAFVKISTTASLAVVDYFTMLNTISESNADADLGSGGLMLLPPLLNPQGQTVSLAVGAGKDTHIYVVDQSNLGKFNPNSDAIYQQLSNALPGGVWSSPAWFNGRLYYGSVGSRLKAFAFANGAFGTAPASQSSNSFGYPGTTPSISANGASNGIVWAAENGGTAVLHAYDASDLSKELYNSNQAANGRDHFGVGNKFIVPTIANGKVYIGTTNGVGVFGLFSTTSAVSVAPNSGSGASQTFQFLASDSSGAADLQTVWVWFTPVFSNSSTNTCLLYYSRAMNALNLLNDAGNTWMPMMPGTAGTLQNSQCSLDLSATTIAPSGNNLTLSIPVSFKAGYAGAKQVWMYAGGTSANSGWQQLGTWTAPAPPPPTVSAVSVTPNTGSGSSQTFQFVSSDTNGATDLNQVWVWITPAFSNSSANSCLFFYNRAANVLNLLNDAGNAWMSMTPGTAGTQQNSQCGVDVSTTTVAPSGNNLTLSMPVSFKTGYAGAKQVWMYAAGTSANSGWQQRGSWTATDPPAPVSAVSVTPNTGSGSVQTFQFLASDTNGAGDLNQVWVWITPAFSTSSANSCLFYYNRAGNVLNLLNDAGNSWMPMNPGIAGILQNSQCSLNAGATTVTPSGNNLTLSIPVSFKAAYAGNQQVWVYAGGGAGNSGWQQKGAWTATAPSSPVVSAVSVSPNTGGGLTQTFQFLASDSNGSADLTQVWVWFTAAFSNVSANSCLLYYSQTANQVYLLNDAGNSWMPMTPGTAGTLQNSQCSLNVGSMALTPSSANLTLSVPMTFKAAYAGAKQVWMYAAGGVGNSSWQQRGSWSVQ